MTSDGKRPEQRAFDWWSQMISDENGDRGVRASLRRCKTLRDALDVPAALGLAKRLGVIPEENAPEWKYSGFKRALSLAIILAHVRSNNDQKLFNAIGWKQFPFNTKENDAGENAPILSELRFKRLLQVDTMEGEDGLIAFTIRVIKLAGDGINVTNLAQLVLDWDKDRTKRDIALTYYRAHERGLAHPSNQTPTPTGNVQ
jgi:CRISPR type I-E-associated protein CasB/Cse2